jgi:hypothetical protein
MPECKTYLYEVMRTTLENGQQVMVQIFRDDKTMEVLHAQLAFKTIPSDSWGVPYQLEVAR